MISFHVCALFCVLISIVFADSSLKYDFFFPGTDFLFDLEGCENENCEVSLLLNGDDLTYEGDGHPRTVFPLTRRGNNVFKLDDIQDLPDAYEMGIYPNAAFQISHIDDPSLDELIYGVTFYKSQTFMSSNEVTMDIVQEGIYSPSLENINYRPSSDINTIFNVTNDMFQQNSYFEIDYSGVKSCDHFVLFDGKKDDKVLGIPTIFNYAVHGDDTQFDRKGSLSYSVGTNKKTFQSQFITNDLFDYASYAPKLNYATENIVDYNSEYNFMDFNWKILDSNGEVLNVEDGDRVHFKRGNDVIFNVTMSINDYFVNQMKEIGYKEYDAAGNDRLYILFAMCHVDRPGDSWAYMDVDTCSNSTYVGSPPYRCVISSEFDPNAEEDNQMKFEHSESTQPISYYNIYETEKNVSEGDGNLSQYSFSMSFKTGSVNPIPFRVVPLVAFEDQGEEESSIIKYRFVPLGPASPIYQIDLTTTPALIFFIVFFISVTALCIIAYFVGKVVRKKVKEKKSNEQKPKPFNQTSENSNVSMVDSSYSSSSMSSKRGRGISEKDKLIESHSSYSSSDKEKRIA